MTLLAKPIVKNQLWVVVDEGNKVGNVEAKGSGFEVKLGNYVSHFDTTKNIEKIASIKFQRPANTKNRLSLPYAVWPTTGKTYNNMLDVKNKMHIYTKTENSKCYYAAGWFSVKLNDGWETIFCPKYIFLQRYPYSGPHMNKDDIQ